MNSLRALSTRLAAVILSLLLVLAFVNCGGGADPAPVNQTVTVSISPATTTGVAGTAMTFTVVVGNTTNAAVTWSIQEGSTAGALSNGVFTPAKAGTFHIVATSVADSTKSAIATVTVTAPTPTFNSQAPTMATEAQAYSYTLSANDPANSALSYTLTSAPTGASLNGSTLAWTPTHTQSRSANTFTVKVSTAAGGSATQSWTVTPTGTINGLALITQVLESGDVDVPLDASSDVIKVHIPGGAAFTTIDGVGDAQGHYTINGVPAGNFWLQNGTDFIWTSRSEIDMGYPIAGRSAAGLASQGTSVSLAADNTTAVTGYDHFEVFSPNAGVLGDAAIATYTPGDTSVNLSIPWEGLNLIDATAGDTTYVSQLKEGLLPGGKHFYFLGKTVQTASFSMVNAATNSLSATLDFPTNTVNTQGLFNGADFAALRTSVNPNATIRGTNIALAVQAMGNSHGSFFWPNPKLIAYYGQDGAITSNVDYSVLGANNPYKTQWPLVIDYDQPFGVVYTLPGTSYSTTMISHIRTQQVPGNSPVTPMVAPVVSPQINGLDLFTPQNGVGTNPVLSWTAPAGAVGYRVLVERFYDSGLGTAPFAPVAALVTTATSIRVPPGVLVAGNYYIFIIQAHAEPGSDYTFSPYRHTLPHGMAPVSTAVVTP